jgi:hypothetical protein
MTFPTEVDGVIGVGLVAAVVALSSAGSAWSNAELSIDKETRNSTDVESLADRRR